jgi:hypothetical protein
MNWIFEIYGDTYKALTLQGGLRRPPSEDGRVKPGHDAIGLTPSMKPRHART